MSGVEGHLGPRDLSYSYCVIRLVLTLFFYLIQIFSPGVVPQPGIYTDPRGTNLDVVTARASTPLTARSREDHRLGRALRWC